MNRNVKEIIKYAHKKGAKVLVDASQSIPHMKVDVRDLDADFLAFSGHKMLAPLGIGVLYGKREILNMSISRDRMSEALTALYSMTPQCSR